MSGGGSLRVLVAAFGDPGHAFPAIALARALAERGSEVIVETWERWRPAVEGEGLRFTAAEEYRVFPPPDPGEGGPNAGDAAVALRPLFEDFRPEVVVSDILTIAPALAAERAGARVATLVPHIYPVSERGMPFFAVGFGPPRTPLGRIGWRAWSPLLELGLRRGREEMNQVREIAGLAPIERLHGGLSEELTIVGTFPQLEYPRTWPGGTHVVGPLGFELAYPDIDLPPGDDPLVLVAASTAQDPEARLVRNALAALDGEPVRVVATLNRREAAAPDAGDAAVGEGGTSPEPLDVPDNATVVPWLSYSQILPRASLVICHGGHGTVARALSEGAPVLSCPAVGDMVETAVRLRWAGVGEGVPWRLAGPAALRSVVRSMLADPAYRAQAVELAAWSGANDGPRRAAELVERLGRHP